MLSMHIGLHCTHTWLVGDPASLVVAGVALLLLGGNIVSHEGGVTLLTELVMTHHLVLPYRVGYLKQYWSETEIIFY